MPPAWLLTAAMAVAYLILAPSSPDLAAASYRSDLFSRVGLLAVGQLLVRGPPPAGLLAARAGARRARSARALLVALAVVAQAVLFERLLAREHCPARAARVASLWFAFGAGFALLSSRVPYDLGLAIGLGALLLARARPVVALVLCLAVLAGEPGGGAFLALALVAVGDRGLPSGAAPWWLLAARWRRSCALASLFPEGGTQPFVPSAFWPRAGGACCCWRCWPAAGSACCGPARCCTRCC